MRARKHFLLVAAFKNFLKRRKQNAGQYLKSRKWALKCP